MSYSSFSRFADGLCSAAGAKAPALAPDAQGLLIFHMIVDEVAVNFIHDVAQEGADDEAFALVTFGKIPAGREHEVLLLLAEANHTLLGSDLPVMGVNPASAEVVLRQRVLLAHTDPQSSFEAVLRLTALARRWRVDPTLGPQDPPAGGGADAAGGFDARRFA